MPTHPAPEPSPSESGPTDRTEKITIALRPAAADALDRLTANGKNKTQAVNDALVEADWRERLTAGNFERLNRVSRLLEECAPDGRLEVTMPGGQRVLIFI